MQIGHVTWHEKRLPPGAVVLHKALILLSRLAAVQQCIILYKFWAVLLYETHNTYGLPYV